MTVVTVRQRHLDAVVTAMLTTGRTDLALPELAEAAETSARMLLYYFGTREALEAEATGVLRERRRQVAVGMIGRLERSPSAVEGIRDSLDWLCEPEQLPLTTLVLDAVVRVQRGDGLYAEFADGTVTDWIEELTTTGRRLGADTATAPVFASLFAAVALGLVTDAAATGDGERLEAAVDAAAIALASLVGAPTDLPARRDPEAEIETEPAQSVDDGDP